MSASPRATGPVSAAAAPSVVDVVDDGAHEREQRLGRHAGRVGERCGLPEQRDEVVRRDRRGRVVRGAPVGGALGTAACPSDTARRSTDGGPVDRAPRAGEARDTPSSGDGSDCSGWSEPTSTSGRAARELVELVERACAGEVDARARPARGPAPVRPRSSAIACVGRRDDDEVGARARRRRPSPPARRGAPRHAASTRASGARPATATGVQPRADERDRHRGTGAAGPHQGERPLRSTVTCTSTFLPFVPAPGAGCRSTRAASMLAGSGGHDCRVGRDPRSAQSGSRSASGTSTKARSAIRGCGTTRSGSSTRSSPTSSTSTSRVRGPQRSARTRLGRGLDAREPSSRSARGRRARCRRRRPRSGSRPARDRPPASVSYTGDTATTRDAVGRGEAVDREPGDARAGRRGSSRSRGTRDASARRAHRSMQTATWSTIARTGGCSLRTVTATAVTRSSTRHTSAMRVARRSSRW